MTNWRLGNFFYFILKGHHHNISKNLKTPLNNFYSHFDWSKSLYADFFDSVKSIYAVIQYSTVKYSTIQ